MNRGLGGFKLNRKETLAEHLSYGLDISGVVTTLINLQR